jgi:hypothetical protein
VGLERASARWEKEEKEEWQFYALSFSFAAAAAAAAELGAPIEESGEREEIEKEKPRRARN